MKLDEAKRLLYPFLYESRQNHNALTTWLHSFRYTHVLKVAKALAADEPRRPLKVMELGCGNAKLFDVLRPACALDYVGIEHDHRFVSVALQRFGARPNFRIVSGSATDADTLAQGGQPDLVVALETLEHIPEHEVVRIVERIAQLRPRRFVCSVPIELGPAVWLKNVGSLAAGYSRHREYSWTETLWAALYQLDRLPPHGIKHKGFDWRWLAQTIRHNMKIVELRRFPVGILPASLSTSVFIVAEPRD